MSANIAEVVKTLYDTLPNEAKLVYRSILDMGRAQRAVDGIVKKRATILPTKQTELAEIRKRKNEILKNIYENGILPDDVSEVQSLHAQIKPINDVIIKARDDAGCGSEATKLYKDAKEVFFNRALTRVQADMGDKSIKAMSTVSAKVMVEITALRTARRNRNK